MWFLQDPVPPYPRILHKAYLEVSSGPGAAGVFRLDSSRRLVAILGRVVTEERRERHLTFVIPSSVLISLALGERRGATIEWEKWKGKVATLEQSSRFSIMWVEGSRVFILGEEGQEAGFTVYNFSPGARKGQKSPPYTSQRLAPAVPPPAWYRSWEVSGDTVVLIDVCDLTFYFILHACLILIPGKTGVIHRCCLVHLNLHRLVRVVSVLSVPTLPLVVSRRCRSYSHFRLSSKQV